MALEISKYIEIKEEAKSSCFIFNNIYNLIIYNNISISVLCAFDWFTIKRNLLRLLL